MKTTRVITRNRIITVSILTALMFWVIDAFVDSRFFQNEDFIHQLILAPDPHDVYMRLLGILFVAIIGTIFAITYSRRTGIETRLQQSEANLNQTQQFSHVGGWEWNIKTNKVIWSDEMYRLFGIAKTEFTGDLNDIIAKTIHPDDIEKVTQSNLSVVNSGKAIPLEYRVTWPDKSIHVLWAEAGELVRDENGNPSVLKGYTQDITERKLSDVNLNKAYQELKVAQRLASVGNWQWDSATGKVEWSDELYAIYGLDPNLPPPKLTPKITTPASWAQGIAALNNIQKTGESYEIELDAVRPDGTVRHTITRVEADFDTNGKITGLHGTTHDITERKKAEEVVRQQSSQLKAAESTAHLGYYQITLSTGQATWSDETFRIFGLDPAAGAPTVETYQKLIHPDDATGLYQMYDQCIKEHKTFDLIYRIVRTDGEIRYVHSIGFVTVDSSGTTIGMFGTLQDITESTRTEQALRVSEQNFRSSLDNSPLAVIINKAMGEPVYVNVVALKLFGFTSLSEMQSSPVRQRHTAENVARIRERWEKINKGEFVSDYVEHDIIRADGEIRRVEAYINNIVWNGREHLQVIYQDITERNLAQIKLEQSVKEWSTTFDSITDLVSIHSKDFRLIRVNRAFANKFDLTPVNLGNRHCYELVHGTAAPPAYCPMLSSMRKGKPEFLEIFESKLGIWAQISTSPIFGDNNEVIACVHAIKDITENRNIQKQLIAQDRLASIGQLVSGVAHELNNPLSSVLLYSEMLAQKELADDILDDLRVIHNETTRAVDIVTNLLTFARKQPEGKTPSDLNDIIRKVIAIRQHEQAVNNITTKLNLTPDLPQSQVNASQMHQVFFNIIINAEQALTTGIYKDGTIVVASVKSSDFIRIIISDNGPGMDANTMNKLFTPFFTTKEMGKGTGLGLSICHGIVTEHGGRVYAESEPGKGARFIVELPVV